MTYYVYTNNQNATLANGISPSDTTILLSSSANLPTLSVGQKFPITIRDAATRLNFEICYATAITGATLTVERGKEGTGAQAWSTSDFVFCGPTAQTVASSLGDPSNTFFVNTATASNHATTLLQLNSGLANKADLAGSSTQQFSVQDGTTAHHAVSLDQLNNGLATKAALAGSSSQQFSVQDATTAHHAVALDQIPALVASQFTQSFSTNGYMIMPNGFILQWGIAAFAVGSPVTISFPIAFPNSILCYGANNNYSAGSGAAFIVSSATLTQMTGYCTPGNNSSNTWFAWGN